jgi:hypothetical protein
MTRCSWSAVLQISRDIAGERALRPPNTGSPGRIEMQNIKKSRRTLSLHTETVRQLAGVELAAVAGGRPPVGTLPCSIPCTDICSSGL